MRLRNIGSVAGSTLKIFRDTFNRANQTGIGTSSDGSTWDSVRGSFNIATNKADGQTPANYPLAAVTMPKDSVTISLSGVTQGSTAAIWVTDSGNWYGIGIDQTTESCNCQTCTTPGNCASYYYACNSYYYACGGYYYACGGYYYACGAYSYSCNVTGNRYCTTYSSPCNVMVGPSCMTWSRVCNAYNSGNCNNADRYPCNSPSWPCGSPSWPCGSPSWPCGSESYPCGSNNADTYYSCNCQTCYPQYIRFIQSASNVVSQLTSWTVANIVQSFKVIISSINPGKTSATATIKPYSDTNLSTQIGSDLTYTPTGVAINARYGIMVKPSAYSQGTTIDEISIESN
jgi:hypothetical protein